MSDYVPYEERRRKDQEARAATTAAVAEAHRARVAQVTRLLDRLDGSGTNCHLEILRRVSSLRRHFTVRTVIPRSGFVGGPHFVISDVLAAYRIQGGIHEPLRKESGSMVYDAYIVPDGRVWRFMGQGEAENIYQLLASSAERLPDLATDDLERIAVGLGECLDVLNSERDHRPG